MNNKSSILKYHADQTKMWDAWFLNINGQIHAFHLQMPMDDCTLPYEDSWSVGHAVSDDMLHWCQCANILPPLRDDSNPLDYGSKFTGCAYQKDDKFYFYYTMRDRDFHSQRIGLALSDNAFDWTIYNNNPVLEPDPSVFIGYGERKCDWGIVDCRDMIVISNPVDGLYYGYFAAAADIGRLSPIGVIAVATSKDLINWENQQIAYTPASNGVVEVPDVYQIDDKWYMTILTGNSYCGRSATRDEYVTNCTVYAVADNPSGPFIEPENNIFIGGVAKSGFTCRTVVKNNKRYLMYVDRPFGVETLSLPKEVRVDERGCLGVYWSDLVEKLRTNELIAKDCLPTIKELPNTSFAWKTLGGIFTKNGPGYIAKTEKASWQAAGFGIGARNIEYNADITLIDANGAGFWIASRGNGVCHNYVFMLENNLQRVFLTEFYGFDYIAARKYPVIQNITYSIKLIMIEGVCELYINGQLLLQCGLEMFDNNFAGLFCDRGQAEFKNISLYSLD